MEKINNMTPVIKNILELLSESPKTDSELLETIPNFSLKLLGKLRDLEAIDHVDHLVYITFIGRSMLNSANSNT